MRAGKLATPGLSRAFERGNREDGPHDGTSAVSGQQLEVLAERGIEHQRLPQGEWIGLDALTRMHSGGPALAEGILHDEHGPLGRAFQTLVVQAR